jgi:hypothetical protein
MLAWVAELVDVSDLKAFEVHPDSSIKSITD